VLYRQVGGFFFVHREDIKRYAPLWLKYTEDVREDPEVSEAAAVSGAPVAEGGAGG
jgi:hypothetical protein